MAEDYARRVVVRYLEAVADHDFPGALALLADDFELVFAGGGMLGKRAMASAMGWDAGTGSVLRWEVVSAQDREVVVEAEETNEFLRLLELGPWPFRSRFTVDGGGRIVRQEYRVEQAGPPVEERLGPVLAPVLAPVLGMRPGGEPGALDGIHSEETGLVHTEEAGRRWVALLQRWRAARDDGPHGEPA